VSFLRLSKCLPNQSFYQIELYEEAYWEFTSGTTGQPKAVVHQGIGVIEHAKSYGGKILDLRPEDIIYSTSKFFFGYGLGNSFFLPFSKGATTVLDSRWPNNQAVLDNLFKYEPTIFFSVPAIYSGLLDAGEKIERNLKSCKRFVSAGAALPGWIFNAWKQRHGIVILDGIGSTEMGHIYLTNTIETAAAGRLNTVIPGYEIKILGSQSSPEKELSGVLCAKGPSRATGYYGLPAKTAERFDSDGWYRTGDVFSESENGGYIYEGREDDHFKIKGRWVSAQKIEEFVANNFRSVKESVLIASDGFFEEETLVLFIVLLEGEIIADDIFINIKNLISDVFESHCIPKSIYLISNLPRNDNGKIIRSDLKMEAAKKISDANKSQKYMKDTSELELVSD